LFFVVGFLFSFSFGGFTGLIIASCIIDSLLHDTYFVVGHFHYVLSLGAVYSIFAGTYSYTNLLMLCSYNETLGRVHYTVFFLSSNLVFLCMHTIGINSLPRRIFDYPIVFARLHWFSSFGLAGIVLSFFIFIFALVLVQ
jgi:heme/copper-type cytochrome/quinol oxidase subunit 1